MKRLPLCLLMAATLGCGTQAERSEAGQPRASSAELAVAELQRLGLSQRVSAVGSGVKLPESSAEPLLLDTGKGGLSVAAHPLIREEQTGEIDVAQQQGGLTHLKLGDVSWVIGGLAQGAEDYLRVPAPQSSVSSLEDSQVVVRYRLDLKGVAGLRLVGGVLEFLDDEGTPQWRVRAPLAIDAAKTKWPLSVGLENCHADTNAAPPWRRPVTAPGSDICVLRLAFSAQAKFPVWVDPQWTTTQSMAVPRARFGSFGADSPAGVMVAGGVDDQGTPLASTETFDAWTHTWSVLEPLRGARVDPIVFGDFGAFVYLLGGASVVERRAWDGGSWEAAGLTQNLVGCLGHVGTAFTSFQVFVGATSEADASVRVEYQSEDGIWVEAQAVNPPAFRAEALCGYHDLGRKGVFWFGGRLGSGEFPTTSWVLKADPSLTFDEQLARVEWTPGPDLSELYPRGVIGAAQWGTQTFGGEDQDGKPLDTVMSASAVASEFLPQALPSLPQALSRASVANSEHGLILAGGRDASGAASNAVYRQMGDVWYSLGDLKEGRYSARLEELQRFDTPNVWSPAGMLMIGGVGDSGVLSSVEYLTGQLGDGCAEASDCWSGFCSQGVCCEEACDRDCVTCAANSAYDPGECHPVAAGLPSPRGCDNPLANPCGKLNICDGYGECKFTPKGTDCGTSCSDGLESSRTCDGKGYCYYDYLYCAGGCAGDHCTSLSCGTLECAEGYVCRYGSCVESQSAPLNCGYCGGYACDATSGQCKSRCDSAADCTDDYRCRKSTHRCEFPADSFEEDVNCGCPTLGPTLSHSGSAVFFSVFACAGFARRRRKPRRHGRQA